MKQINSLILLTTGFLTLLLYSYSQIKQYKDIVEHQEEKIHKMSEEIRLLNEIIKYKEKKLIKLQEQIAEMEKKEEEEELVFEVTAYSAGYESTGKWQGHPEYGITASGKLVEEGVTVACPPSMEFGTKLYIETIGYRICEDRGGAITEGHLDVYMENYEEALNFGRRKLKVKIID